MHTSIKNSFAALILMAIVIGEWLTKKRTPTTLVRIILFSFGTLYLWAAARLFMYEERFAAPNIRPWLGILAVGIAFAMFSTAFPATWARIRRSFGF